MTTASTYSDEFARVAGLLNTNWKQGSPLAYITPILWPGVTAAVPTDTNGNKIAHIRFFIMNGIFND